MSSSSQTVVSDTTSSGPSTISHRVDTVHGSIRRTSRPSFLCLISFHTALNLLFIPSLDFHAPSSSYRPKFRVLLHLHLHHLRPIPSYLPTSNRSTTRPHHRVTVCALPSFCHPSSLGYTSTSNVSIFVHIRSHSSSAYPRFLHGYHPPRVCQWERLGRSFVPDSPPPPISTNPYALTLFLTPCCPTRDCVPGDCLFDSLSSEGRDRGSHEADWRLSYRGYGVFCKS